MVDTNKVLLVSNTFLFHSPFSLTNIIINKLKTLLSADYSQNSLGKMVYKSRLFRLITQIVKSNCGANLQFLSGN